MDHPLRFARLGRLACALLAPLFFVSAARGQGIFYDLSQTTASEKSYVSGGLIFPLKGRITPQCHASTLAELPGGGIVAAWFAGTRERAPDVGIAVAHYADGKWGRPELVADGVQDTPTTSGQKLRFACWNPVLFQPSHAPLLLFYKVGPSPALWWGMLKTSADGGKAWSAAVRLPDGYLGPVKDKPIELPDGTLLCGSSTEGKGGRHCHVEFARVDADGKIKWLGKSEVPDPDGGGLIQPTILQHPHGVLQMLMRSKTQKLFETWSKDGGKTWSPAAATDLPNPDSGVDGVSLKDGRQLLVYNHTIKMQGASPDGEPINRTMLNVAISKDGKDWRPVMVLDLEPRSQFSYPAVIQTRDGMVHITYTWNRLSIKHVELEPGKIE